METLLSDLPMGPQVCAQSRLQTGSLFLGSSTLIALQERDKKMPIGACMYGSPLSAATAAVTVRHQTSRVGRFEAVAFM